MDLDRNLFLSAMGNVVQRHAALVNLLGFLGDGGDPHSFRPGPWGSLLDASAAAGWDDAVRVLIEASAGTQDERDTALISAAYQGHLVVVERLLSAGASVHAHDDAPLRMAAGDGILSVVECLLAAGADVHACRDEALRRAAQHGHLPVVERLLGAGADVHVGHESALHAALSSGNIPLARRLLSHGADAAHAWAWTEASFQSGTAATLNALAAELPVAQRRALALVAPHRFPAVCSLLAAEQRLSRAPRGGWVR